MVKLLRFKQLLVLIALLLCSVTSFAYDFEVDGIYYNKLSENTVEVTFEKYENSAHITDSYIGEMTIPSYITVEGNTYNVTSIGSSAFSECGGLTSITIPDGITSIGSSAFYECYCLTSINIPNGVTAIENSTFEQCHSLKSITIPDGVTSIGEEAFYKSGLESINMGNGVTSIGTRAFYYTSLTSITIPNGLATIGYRAFLYCDNLKEINISSIENWMRINMGEDAFTSNYDIMINGLKLTDLVVPESITTIGRYSFYRCVSLESITLHKGVTTILQGVFPSSNVKKIVCQGEVPPVCAAGALSEISRTECTLYVPKTSISSYQNTTPWSEFTNIVGGGTETPDTPKTCEAPTITFDNEVKKLIFTSATESAEYHYTITSDDINTSEKKANEATMTGVYTITAYASADGMYNSEKTTAKLCWVSAAIESDGIMSANADRGVIVSNNGNQINISGTVNGEAIEVYNVSGSKLKEVRASGASTTISGLQSGNVYVVKIGGSKVKVAM